MASTELIPTTQEHVEWVSRRARKADTDELWAAGYLSPEACMRSGASRGVAITGLIDQEPVAVWGVVPASIVLGIGVPWMVTTRALDDDARARVFLRACRAGLATITDGYDILMNYVDARNGRAIRWLRFMGFDVDPVARPYGAMRLPFHRFTWRRGEPCAHLG